MSLLRRNKLQRVFFWLILLFPVFAGCNGPLYPFVDRKDDRPVIYSGNPLVSSATLANLRAVLAIFPANTAAVSHTIKLKAVSIPNDWGAVNTIVRDFPNKHIILDLSGCTVTGNTVRGEIALPPLSLPSGNDMNIIWDAFNITGIVLPPGLASIGDNAFFGCYSLTSITIPPGIASIGVNAFFGCTSLASITIPPGVTTIGVSAFNRCRGLTSVTIPTSVTAIANGAFSDCTSLTGIIIPGSVTSIESSTFTRCSGLISVTIPPGVTSIGSFAFEDCSGLTSVTIPPGVTSIESYAFRGCSGLTSVTISSGVTSIESWAFSGCTDLTSITIPGSVTSIDIQAFGNCSGLTSVTFEPGSNIATADFDTYAFDGDLAAKYLAEGAGTYTRNPGGNVWTKL